MHKPGLAAAHAIESATSGVGMSSLIDEGARATGVYDAVCVGYRSVHEKEYLREYPRLLAMRARREQLLKYTPKFANGLISKFLKELEDFEAYMKSLTEVKWADKAPNLVTTVGKNLALDTFLAGSSYTVTGPYMGLVSSVSYSALSASDTMSSHAGWTEAGNANAPTYTSPRKTISWSSASGGSKSPSSAPVFAITGSGTVKGVFLVFGSGAVSTIDNTSGTLYSVGLFSGGDQAVVNTNTLTVTYTASL